MRRRIHPPTSTSGESASTRLDGVAETAASSDQSDGHIADALADHAAGRDALLGALLADRNVPAGFAELRSMPVVRSVPKKVHPLRVYVEERGLRLRTAAEHLGVSERWLRSVVNWTYRVPNRKARWIARALGEDPTALFPDPSAEGLELRPRRRAIRDHEELGEEKRHEVSVPESLFDTD